MSNQQNKITARTARPTTLAGAVGGLMRLFGVRASDADLVARWDEIMGPDIAASARIAGIRKTRDNKFTIAIRPTNPAMSLTLSYRADEITARINKYFGYDAVGKITFRR